MNVLPRILYCHCAYAQVVPLATKTAVLKRLAASGQPFEAVADLCELSARRDPSLKPLAEGGAVKIAACFPRAVKWLFASAHQPLAPESTEILNMREQSAEQVGDALLGPELKANLPSKVSPAGPAAGLNQSASSPADPAKMPLRLILYEGPGSQPWSDEERFALLTALLDKGWSVSRVLAPEAVLANDDRLVLVLGRFNGPVPAFGAGDSARMQVRDATGFDPARVLEEAEAFRAGTQTPKAGAWLPWFPVIDYDRCTNCMQCLSFCLFDVYGVSADQKIEVHHSANCKTNCPACSRVCPEAAIMFPKYKTGPIHGGEVTEADLRREAMKVDISALLGGDIYSLLRQRSTQARTRFSKERDPDQALQERRKCLTKLAQMADIPPEVLMSLPSPEEIQRRATEAAAKAKAALAQRSEELKG